MRLIEPAEVVRLKAIIESMQAEHEKMAGDLQNLQRDVRAKMRRITFLENELAGRYRNDEHYETAHKIFEFWRKHCCPRARTFSEDRLKAVLARLRDKRADDPNEPAYSPRYICEAVLGAKYGAYVDEKGKAHRDLELICRSGRRLEAFHDKYEAHVARKAATA